MTTPISARRMGTAIRLAAVAGALLLCACGEPPSWQKLLTAKITEQYPAYKVTPSADGNLTVERPGMSTLPVDVDGIAKFCLRGTKDCNYATDQMLTELGK